MPADTIAFTKGHGTGNDFVVIPDPDGLLDLSDDQVAALCDRRFGIGADGILRVVRSAAPPPRLRLTRPRRRERRLRRGRSPRRRPPPRRRP